VQGADVVAEGYGRNNRAALEMIIGVRVAIVSSFIMLFL
jgi:hypothetical protein